MTFLAKFLKNVCVVTWDYNNGAAPTLVVDYIHPTVVYYSRRNYHTCSRVACGVIALNMRICYTSCETLQLA